MLARTAGFFLCGTTVFWTAPLAQIQRLLRVFVSLPMPHMLLLLQRYNFSCRPVRLYRFWSKHVRMRYTFRVGDPTCLVTSEYGREFLSEIPTGIGSHPTNALYLFIIMRGWMPYVSLDQLFPQVILSIHNFWMLLFKCGLPHLKPAGLMRHTVPCP